MILSMIPWTVTFEADDSADSERNFKPFWVWFYFYVNFFVQYYLVEQLEKLRTRENLKSHHFTRNLQKNIWYSRKSQSKKLFRIFVETFIKEIANFHFVVDFLKNSSFFVKLERI